MVHSGRDRSGSISRSSSNSRSLRGAFGCAPALEKVALAGVIVAAFGHAYTPAGPVVDKSEARPFVTATQVRVARKEDINRRRIAMDPTCAMNRSKHN
jgi:hypothetical protein